MRNALIHTARLAAFLLLCGHATGAPAAPETEARAAAQRFVQEYLRYAGGPREHSAWLQQWAKTMTPNLAGLVEGALLADSKDACDGPPVLGGDMLTSLAEGPSAATIAHCSVSGPAAKCVVEYTHQEPRDPEPYRWKELIGLEKVGKTWLVSEYVQAESWREELSLANKLKRAIRQASVCP